MTDPMELVGRADEKNAPGHINLIDSDTTEELLDLIAEMATCSREMVEWRPIETAPRDGSRLIGLLKSGRAVTISCRKHHNGFVQKPDGGWVPNGILDDVWCEEEASAIVPRNPTHWLPLPPAPGAEDE